MLLKIVIPQPSGDPRNPKVGVMPPEVPCRPSNVSRSASDTASIRPHHPSQIQMWGSSGECSAMSGVITRCPRLDVGTVLGLGVLLALDRASTIAFAQCVYGITIFGAGRWLWRLPWRPARIFCCWGLIRVCVLAVEGFANG